MDCASRGVDRKAERPAIAGGFVLIPVASLMAAWRACRARPLGIGDFRAWLAAREMRARRCVLGDAREPAYTVAELAALLGITPRRARASLRRLEAAGLVLWSGSAIRFPEPADTAADELVDTIGRGRGSLAIPRRMLRHLAAGARPALIATALGILLRCLTRRRDGFDGRGRLKCSWVAAAFGVEPRRVQQARAELVGLGWIAPEDSRQWAWNRWGRAYRIDLGWGPPRPGDGPPLAPPPAGHGPRPAPPESDPDPLRGHKNQEPASGRPAGVQSHETGTEQAIAEAGPPPPRLDDVRAEDLKDTGRLLELHGQAVARGLVGPSEADRLRFVSAAEHALAVGRANPPGLFFFLVRGRCWRYLSGDDEDRANARLKARIRPPTPAHRVPRSGGRGPAGPWAGGGPSDGEVVRAVRQAAIRAGIFRDPWPEFSRLNPGWTRERWDRAVG